MVGSQIHDIYYLSIKAFDVLMLGPDFEQINSKCNRVVMSRIQTTPWLKSSTYLKMA